MEDITRYSIVRALMDQKMTNKEGAESLGISTRQMKRIKKKVQTEGPSGIIHGNRGRNSPRAFPDAFRDRVISLAQTKYFDFNFSHLSEKLKEKEDIQINRETIRQWLRPLGFGRKISKQPQHRKRRKRSEKEGQMLFLDGSPHRWFGGEESTLILTTDDATGKPLYGLFQKEEDLNGCFRVCREVFTTYGLPGCFYLDKASQFTTTRHGGLHVAQKDTEPTQFERAMKELGIRLIFADSPQARGRGERINQTFQDRLVSELRLERIASYQEATTYLNEIFIPKYSQRFGVVAEDPLSAWRAIPEGMDIRDILCKRYQRRVNQDNTISVNGQIIQLLPTKKRLHFAKAHVVVNHWLDGTWHIVHATEGEIPSKPITGARPAGALLILKAGGRSESVPVRRYGG